VSGHVFLSGFRGSEAPALDETSIQTSIRTSCEREGPISLAINLVAPLFPDFYAPLDTLSPPLFDDVLSECVERTFLLMKHQLPALENGGSILNVVSHLALEGGRGAGHISAAHHAIVGLTQAAARSWSGRARLNVVCVGKQFIAVERALIEDELLDFGVALVAPSFRFLSGQTLMLDAGLGAY
jgi:NAD(P)-dependent dehydrogenase (short-subunit alcohol dehydrogenase family)